MDGGRDQVVECTAWKATRLTDIVTRRRIRLCQHPPRVCTVHHADASSEKSWLLDRSCKLEPEYADELVAERRTVRPPGTWTVTAKLTTVTGSGQDIMLYCVTLVWPTSFIAKGYTSLTLGFETAGEAARWHACVQQQLSQLRLRAGGRSSIGHSPQQSCDDKCLGPGLARKVSQDKGFVASALEHLLGSKGKYAGSLCFADTQPPGALRPHSAPAAASKRPNRGQAAAFDLAAMSCADAALCDDDDDDSYSYSSSSYPDDAAAATGGGDMQPEQRWVPYRHTNGVAIYHHKESKCSAVWPGCAADAGEDVGSEYMASSIVRGSPDECLAVLTDLSSNTTILGPASGIQLLEDGAERQVLRIMVEATGMARRLCAPRELIVERLFKREECGVDVILFSSCEPPPATPDAKQALLRRPTASAQGMAAAAAAAAAGGTGDVGLSAAATAAAVLVAVAAAAVSSLVACISGHLGGVPTLLLLAGLLAGLLLLCAVCNGRSSRGLARPGWCECLGGWVAALLQLWHRPVRAYVQGGYTISPREDGQAPECLVTCILKVDLGGHVGERSWLRPLTDALGWVDAYVERMLMAVILVKDEVEQRRFLVQPFSILNNRAAGVGAGSVAGDVAAGQRSSADISYLSQQPGQQQQQQLRRQQLAGAGQAASEDASWLQQQHLAASGRPYDAAFDPQQQLLAAAAASDIVRQQNYKHQQQQKQRGPLGRMASRIYALRPRMLRGGERSAVAAAAAAVSPVGSASFRSLSHSMASPRDAREQSGSGLLDAAPGSGSAAAAAAGAAADLSDARVLLSALDMPADTVVVGPHYYLGGPQGPAAADSSLNKQFWSELHTPGRPAPFKLRGPSYLADATKVDGGVPQFVLGSVDLVETPGPTQHISRFLPAVRCNQAAYSFVVNLIIPGTPVLSLVAVFINEHHPDILEQPPPAAAAGDGVGDTSTPSSSGSGASSRPAAVGEDEAAASLAEGSEDDGDADSVRYERPADTGDWQPFDYALHRFLHGGQSTRTGMFKLIPHIAEGSWVIKQSVGTVPVIVGNKLKTVYYQTDRYIEATVDVTSSSAAAYITGMVRGATKSLVIDLGFVLEGQRAEELPEALLGAFRLHHLDCTSAARLDTSQELPLQPRPLQQHQLVALQQAAQQGLAAAAAAAAGSERAGAAGQAAQAIADAGAAAAATAAAEGGENGAGGGGSGEAADAAGAPQEASQAELLVLSPQLQQRCRNSVSVTEGSRTMTGHSHSRSAASVEELLASPAAAHQGAPHSTGRSKLSQSVSCSFSATQQQQQQQQQQEQQQAADMGPTMLLQATNSQSLGGSSNSSEPGCAAAAASGRPLSAAPGTGDKAPAAAAAADKSAASCQSITPPRQLLTSLLNFAAGSGSVERSGGSNKAAAASAAAAAAASPDAASTAADGSAGHAAALAAAAAGTPATAPGQGTLRAASGSPGPAMTPLLFSAASDTRGMLHRSSLPNQGSAPAAAGAAVPGTPSSSSPAAVPGRCSHQRTRSTSDSARTGSWTASPPEWSSKLSAAAYISRAHQAALAASAQKRGQHSPSRHAQHHQHQQQQAAVAAAGDAEAAAQLGGDAGGACWLPKRPRTSSNSSGAVMQEHHHQLQQAGAPDVLAVAAAGAGGGGSGGLLMGLGQKEKISAVEQLRLTQSTIRTPPAPSSSSSSSCGQQPVAGEAGAGFGSRVQQQEEGRQDRAQLQSRFTHRRFASSSALQ